MGYDNTVFNVNGESFEQLQLAVKLLFSTTGNKKQKLLNMFRGMVLFFIGTLIHQISQKV